ncbi:MAG: metal ABC transporter ATP-binding protein [Chloroflexi bacterium]|nr:metal ABC transporter ATP-binding protein [Chloroflexota bacterium]MYF22865.1 metal ABC transporter ATP-binding protein [Chloroflexota bacterium]
MSLRLSADSAARAPGRFESPMTITPVSGAEVSIRGVSVGYPGHPVFEDLTLNIPGGVFTGIIGGNGSGKSTLLKTIAGLLAPSHGEVLIGGESPEDARGYLGYMPQVSNVDWRFPITVRELVEMGRYHFSWLRRVGRIIRSREDQIAVDRALEMMDVRNLQNRQITELSGGQRKRALIARALARQPRILLLDEPSAALDAVSDDHLFDILCDLTEMGTSVIMTTHDLSTVIEHYSEVICINAAEGGVIAQGDPSTALTEDVLRRTFGRELAILSRGDVHVDDGRQDAHHTINLGDELQLHMDDHEHQEGHRHS